MIRYLCNVNSKPLLDMKSRYLPIMIVAVLLLSGCCSKQSKIDYAHKGSVPLCCFNVARELINSNPKMKKIFEDKIKDYENRYK